MAMLEEELDTLAKNLASSAEQCKVKRQRATSSKRKRALDVTVAEVLSEAKKLERRGKHTKKKGILPSTSRSSSYYYGPSGKIIAKTVNLRKSKTKVHTTSSGSSKSFELLDSGTLRTIEDCQVDFAGAGGDSDVVEDHQSPATSAADGPDIEHNYLEDVVDSLKALPEVTIKKSSGWKERMEAREENWESAREKLFEETLIYSALPECARCTQCGSEDARVKCHQCGPARLLCSSCDDVIHSSLPLHDRKVWLRGIFQPVAPTSAFLNEELIEQGRCMPFSVPGYCPICKAKGRFDLNDCVPVCTSCGEDIAVDSPHDIIREEYWPGSTGRRPFYVFDQDLFELYDLLVKNNPGLSESGFLRALGQFSDKKGRNSIINRSTFAKAFSEWRYCRYEVQKMQGLPLVQCPACYPDQHSVHFDGNRKLYRYSKVPRGVKEQYYEGAFIVQNRAVDNHLEKLGYKDEVMRDSAGTCGSTRWKAAKATSKTMANLDETGLEVAGCRHVIGQKAINMFRGEIFGYPHFLHLKFKSVPYVWADIMCQYWKWAQTKQEVSEDFAEALSCTPCLSIMHANAHSWQCQVIWSGRWQENAAYGPGEQMEQLFSYLSRFNSTTKNMTANHREEQLTEAVFYWNSLKQRNLPKLLKERYQEVDEKLLATTQEFLELQHEVGQILSHDFCRSCIQDIQAIAQKELLVPILGITHNEQIEYFKMFHSLQVSSLLQPYLSTTSEALAIVADAGKLFTEVSTLSERVKPNSSSRLADLERKLSNELCLPIDQLLCACKEKAVQASVVDVENQIEMQYLWMKQKLANIHRASTSSKQRARLRHSVSLDKQSIAKLGRQYNIIANQLQTPPPQLTDEDLENGTFPWSELSGRTQHPAVQEKYRIAVLYNQLQRLREEKQLLKKEMLQLIEFYHDTMPSTLQMKINDLRRTGYNSNTEINHSLKYCVSSNPSSHVLAGIEVQLQSGLCHCQEMLEKAIHAFQTIDAPDFTENEVFRLCSLNDDTQESPMYSDEDVST